jgi:uncharacterized protein YfeS
MDNFELSRETAHPNAKKSLIDDFYWSTIDESGPFGNDVGSDAFYEFRQWRTSNQKISPTIFLKELTRSWDFPPFDLDEMDTIKIKQYALANTRTDDSDLEKYIPAMLEHFKSRTDSSNKQLDETQLREIMAMTSRNMGVTYLSGINNAIIAVGFGQLVIEGRIDNDLILLVKKAIQRERMPLIIDGWEGKNKNVRVNHLTKMLKVLETLTK